MKNSKVIKVFEAFAGIGAQHKALKNIDKNSSWFKVVKTSEWDARAVIAYAQIHNKNIFNKELKKAEKLSEEKVDEYFLGKTYSLNSKTPSNILRKKLSFKQNLMAAAIANNNLPDINKVSGKELKDIDLVTYSFPCQGLSIANMGRGEGIKEDANSTSNLIWQVRRMLLEAHDNKIKLPKFLLMENVKNLLSKKHKKDYDEWVKFLKDLGYNTKTLVINGLDHGSIQRRERVFGISILDWKNNTNDIDFYKIFNKKYSNRLSLRRRHIKYIEILNSSDGMLDEINSAIPNSTKSRKRMAKDNHDLFTRKWKKEEFKYTFNTLTTKQDRHPNIGMIKLPENLKRKGKLNYRFITAREAYQIMGFTSEDFSNVKEKYNQGFITKESLYRQAGNSIVVNVLEDIFRFIKEVK